MYLGSNKQNQIRYHGKAGLDNHNLVMGAVSPNGGIMPDFSTGAPALTVPRTTPSSGSFDFNKVLNFVAPLGRQALDASFQLKILKLNAARQDQYLRQQELIAQQRNFQSFAAQNPVATQGTNYLTNAPAMLDAGFDMSKYMPYILGGVALLAVVLMTKKG